MRTCPHVAGMTHNFFGVILNIREISLSSLGRSLCGLQILEFEKLQLFKVSERSAWKNLFPVFLGRIASDFILPKCKLELEVNCNMLTSSYLVVDPTPDQNEWSHILGKND